MSRALRYWVRGGIVAVAVCALAAVATSQEVQGRQLGQGSQPVVGYLGIPGMYMLGTEKVQKELGLVDEQKQKLQDIATKYREQTQEAWAGWRDVPAEKRQAKMAEIREKTKKLAEQARKDAEGVLLKHQLDALKKLVFRSRAQYSLQNARVQQEIGLDEAQLNKLRELREELQERIRELNAEMLDKSLEILTPEQRKKLEDTSWQSVGQGYNFGGGIVYPAARKAD